MQPPPLKTPICLVTGFLGSGKTTLLRHITQTHAHQRIAFLINEFSTHDVDGHALASQLGTEPDVTPVAGGSIFCNCLVTRFCEVMNQLADKHRANPLDGVVVEASGIADPSVAPRMLAETGLDQHFHLAHTICIVAPHRLATLLKTLPNTRAQIAAADSAIINMIDLHPADECEATQHLLLDINPNLRIHHAAYARTDLDLFQKPTDHTSTVKGDYAKCADPNYHRWIIDLRPDATRPQLETLLNELREHIYRAKGWARLDGHWLLVDIAASRVRFKPAADHTHDPRLMIIGPAECREAVDTLLHKHHSLLCTQAA